MERWVAAARPVSTLVRRAAWRHAWLLARGAARWSTSDCPAGAAVGAGERPGERGCRCGIAGGGGKDVGRRRSVWRDDASQILDRHECARGVAAGIAAAVAVGSHDAARAVEWGAARAAAAYGGSD